MLKRLAIFVSGSGSDMQSIIDGTENGYINGKVVYVVASKPNIFAIERAKAHGIEYGVFQKKDYSSSGELCSELCKVMQEKNIDLIVLAGYLQIITIELINTYRNKIINIHPALIPHHCGMGYYGIKVHQAVIAAGDKESGATVHYVDEIADNGDIIMQATVPVLDGDTPESLAARVLELEHRLLPDAVKKLCEEK